MLFSVIIPCYNAEATIIRALQSVINQTLNDLEIIIVDDGSTDNSSQNIKIFFENKNIPHIFIQQKNNGAASARNLAVKNSHGKYLAFLDADDEWHTNKLEIQYRYIKSLKAKFISCEYTYNNLKTFEDAIDIKEYAFKDFLLSNRTSTPCTVIQRDLFNQVNGFQENQRYSEDYYLWLRSSYFTNLYKLNLPLVKLHKSAYGEDGLSAHLWEMEKSEIQNYITLYHLNLIGILNTIKYIIISFLKFLRRYFLVKIKRFFI